MRLRSEQRGGTLGVRGLRLPCLLTGEGDLAGETLGLAPPWLLTGEGDLAGETLGVGWAAATGAGGGAVSGTLIHFRTYIG